MQAEFSHKFDQLYTVAEAYRAEAREFMEKLLSSINHEEANTDEGESLLHDITRLLKQEAAPFGLLRAPKRTLRGEFRGAYVYTIELSQERKKYWGRVFEMPFEPFRRQTEYRRLLLEMNILTGRLSEEIRDKLTATEIGTRFQNADPFQAFDYKKLFEVLDELIQKNAGS